MRGSSDALLPVIEQLGGISELRLSLSTQGHAEKHGGAARSDGGSLAITSAPSSRRLEPTAPAGVLGALCHAEGQRTRQGSASAGVDQAERLSEQLVLVSSRHHYVGVKHAGSGQSLP